MSYSENRQMNSCPAVRVFFNLNAGLSIVYVRLKNSRTMAVKPFCSSTVQEALGYERPCVSTIHGSCDRLNCVLSNSYIEA